MVAKQPPWLKPINPSNGPCSCSICAILRIDASMPTYTCRDSTFEKHKYSSDLALSIPPLVVWRAEELVDGRRWRSEICSAAITIVVVRPAGLVGAVDEMQVEGLLWEVTQLNAHDGSARAPAVQTQHFQPARRRCNRGHVVDHLMRRVNQIDYVK